MATFFRKLNFAASGILALIGFAVEAQDVSQAELAECASKPTAAEKLVCYEALTTDPLPTPAEPAAETPELATQAPIVETPPPPAPAADSAHEPPAEMPPAKSVAAGSAAELPAAPTPAAAEPESPPPAAADSRSGVPDDLGKEQLGIEDETVDPSPVTAVVKEVTQSGSGRLYFHFSNGQVWRQIEPRRFQYPKDQEFEVTVSKGMMREYRLRVGGKGPMTRIRRVE